MSVLAIQSVSQAAPLNLVKGYPDVFSDFVTVHYTAPVVTPGTGTLVINGVAESLQFTLSGPTETISNGGMDLTVLISVDASGHATGANSPGGLVISGTTSSYGSSPLLTGDLDQFGFLTSGGNIFEFTFTNIGGSAAALFGPQVGMIVNAKFGSIGGAVNFTGLFNADFHNSSTAGEWDGVGEADTFAVPEPTSIALVGLTGLTLISRRRN